MAAVHSNMIEDTDNFESIACRIGLEDISEFFRMKDIDGVNYTDVTTPATLAAVRTFDVRDDDVFVCTYPKSGAHWMAEICHLLFTDGHLQEIPLERRSPGRLDMHLPDPVGPVTRFFEHLGSDYPRVMECHLNENLLPDQVWKGKGKVICVIRNPKDVIASSCRFLLSDSDKKFDKQLLSFFLRSFFNGKFVYGSWFDYVKGFWARRHVKNLFIISYEEMTKNLNQVVHDLGVFLEKSLDADAIARIAQNAAIGKMRETYKKLEEKGGINMTRLGGRLPYVVQGGVGSWKEYFTVEQNEEFDAKFQEFMHGCEIPVLFEI